MEYNPRTRTVTSYLSDIEKGKISFDVPIQRKQNQWKPKQKNRLILTMLSGYMQIPSIHVEQKENGKLYVIDGLQRLSTIYNFVNDGWKLDKKLKNFIDDDGREYVIAKKRFSELPEELKDKILQTEIVQIKYSGYTDKQIADIFASLNNGTPLSNEQKMKASIPTDILLEIDNITSHPFFDKTALTKRQRIKGEDVSIILQAGMLISNYQYKSFSVKDLQEYVDVCNINTFVTIRKAVDVLNIIFEEKQKKLKKVILPMVIAGTVVAKNKDKYFNNLKEFIPKYRENEIFNEYCVGATLVKAKVDERWNYFLQNIIQ